MMGAWFRLISPGVAGILVEEVSGVYQIRRGFGYLGSEEVEVLTADEAKRAVQCTRSFNMSSSLPMPMRLAYRLIFNEHPLS